MGKVTPFLRSQALRRADRRWRSEEGPGRHGSHDDDGEARCRGPREGIRRGL